MNFRKLALCIALAAVLFRTAAAAPAPAPDPLNRTNPRAAITGFLVACHQDDFSKAAEYLDLSRLPARQREQEGPILARNLEALLNSATHFDILRLSRDSQGNPEDDTDPDIEHITTLDNPERAEPLNITLRRSQPANGPAIWLFSPATVAAIPRTLPALATASAFEKRLPRFLVATQLLETPLWKWIALVSAALALFLLFRLSLRLLHRLEASLSAHFHKARETGAKTIAWLPAILAPILVLLILTFFRIFEALVAPAALTRLYIGRALLLLVIGSIAWGVVNLLDYLIVRLEAGLTPHRRAVSHSVIDLGRRTLKAMISIFAAITILDNWGLDMTTIIAGLGVGGIAVALAAQQTLANLFGGVSVIGDGPVMVGDYGNFGGVLGTIENIGLRSARVRTLNRTVMSIPNSAFAAMNIENYTVRDKILFNPKFTISRATPKEQIHHLIAALEQLLKTRPQIETGPSPVRISAFAAPAFTLEIFAYVLTKDVDEYYRHEADLYLAINEVIDAGSVTLV